jgi:hypothetical protein
MRIGDGIVTALSVENGHDAGRFLETNVPAGAIVYGSPLLNPDGEIEGISTTASRALGENTFLASRAILMYTTPTPSADENNPS